MRRVPLLCWIALAALVLDASAATTAAIVLVRRLRHREDQLQRCERSMRFLGDIGRFPPGGAQ